MRPGGAVRPAEGGGGGPDDEYEVLIARHGTRTGLRSEAFLNHGLSGDPDGPIVTDYYVWVLRGPTWTVFVDTGFAEASARRRGRTVLHRVADLYRRIGVDPSDGSPLIVTHAHWDHIGNLDLFPRSAIWIARREAEFWETAVASAPSIAGFTERAELERLAALRRGGRLREFAGEAEVAPGVRVIEVGGHTPGQAMVTVRTAAGVVLLTSDAVHFREELDDERPFVAVTDLPAMIAGYRRVAALRDSSVVRFVITGHDPGEREAGSAVAPDIRRIGG